MVVESGNDDFVRWWDLTTGNPVGERMRAGEDDDFVDSYLTPDGMQLVTGTRKGIIRLWDTSGRPRQVPFTGGKWSWRDFSRDGKNVVTCTRPPNGSVSVWNTSGVRLAGPLKLENISGVKFTSDGKRVYTHTTSSGTATYQLWDFSLKPIGQPIQTADSDAVYVEFNADASRVLIHNDGVVRLLSTDGAKIKKRLFEDEKCKAAEFSSDGKLIFTSADHVACLWDANGKRLGEPMRASGEFEFNPIAKRVGASDPRRGVVRIWDENAIPVSEPIRGGSHFKFSPDGQRVVTWGRYLRVWDADGRPIGEAFRNPGAFFNGHFEMSPDNSRLLIVESNKENVAWRMWLYEVSGRSLGCWYDERPFRVTADTRLFTPDGQRIIIQRDDSPSLILSARNFAPSIAYSEDENDVELNWNIESVGTLASLQSFTESADRSDRLHVRTAKDGGVEVFDKTLSTVLHRLEPQNRRAMRPPLTITASA